MKESAKSQFFREKLSENYQNEICHLTWDKQKPWTLLFAVILSAQCTDKRVNMVTPKLFKHFPDLESFVAKPLELIEQQIYSTGFFRSKSKSLKGAAEKLLLEFGGEVPNTMKDLVRLPGVGRKTANVILWNVFQKNEGFVVDTHVGRITKRFGLTKETSPAKAEKDLMAKFPRKFWGIMSHQLVQFGRDFCVSQKPKCQKCFLAEKCPFEKKVLS